MAQQANQNRNPIASAVERARAAATRYASEKLSELAAADWNLDTVAPRARSTMSRPAYKQAQARRNMFELLTVRDYDRAPSHMPHPLPIRKASAENVARYIQNAVELADAQFTVYIGKLTAKVSTDETSPVGTAYFLDESPLWNGSTLSIQRHDGSIEKWNTKMILNVSVLGTLFNQWPTRRVK